MPKTDETPQFLKPFVFHGANLTAWPVGSNQAAGDCPWCGKVGKFYVSIDTGKWDCKGCGAEGNVMSFLWQLHEEGSRQSVGYGELAGDRGLEIDTLVSWGVCQSPLTNEWLLPAYGPNGRICQIYRYVTFEDGRKRLCATPGLSHGLYGMHLYDGGKPGVMLCEGPWDGMALWEAMRSVKEVDGGYAPTGNEAVSLLSQSNVLATPSAWVFEEGWLSLFGGKHADLLYDNDHPIINPKSGKASDGAGLAGVKRAAALLAAGTPPPRVIRYLAWGKDGYNQHLPSGWDVRDTLRQAAKIGTGAAAALRSLFSNLAPIPDDWLSGRTRAGVAVGSPLIEPLPCSNWNTLVTAWRKALKWHEGLDRALSVMLAAVVSTDTRGDSAQLWVKVMGPPGCGKTTLCEAMGLARGHIFQTSVFTGFHSGYKSDKEGAEDHSLIPKVKGKTLVVKDGDTLLRLPNRDQVLAEARDVFDGASRAHYRHGVSRQYDNIRMTFILCGTGALMELDASELGARFLNCKIMDEIDEEFERGVNWKVAYAALENARTMANGRADSLMDPDKLQARRLTAGYVEYLRASAGTLLGRVEMDERQLARTIALGEFVAHMRARPSKRQDEVAEREFSSRLVDQYIRLTVCLTAVLGGTAVGEEVMRRVRRVAFDTAAGRSLDLVSALHEAGEGGMDVSSVVHICHETEESAPKLLKYLRRIKVVEQFVHKPFTAIKGSVRWRLAPRVRRLYEEVRDGEGSSVGTAGSSSGSDGESV